MMKDAIEKLTESTLIPLSFVVIISGGIFWAAHMDNEVSAHTKKLTAVEERLEQIGVLKTDMAVVKENVQFIKEQLQRGKK